MDVVLEVFDTFALDRFWAIVHPAVSLVFYDSVQDGYANATFSKAGEVHNAYQYSPATQLFSLEPSVWAYRSAWPRDNIYRQIISLYLITW